MAVQGPPQDIHVGLAAQKLLVLKPEVRPSTKEKLIGVLRRRGCCSYSDFNVAKPTEVLLALLPQMKEATSPDVSKYLPLLELLASALVAAQGAGEETEHAPAEATSEVKLVSSRMMTMLQAGSGPDKANDIDSVAAWLCNHSRMRIATDADALFNEMSKRGAVGVAGDKMTYDDSTLKQLSSSSSGKTKQVESNQWLLQLFKSKPALQILKGAAKSGDGIGVRFVPCAARIPIAELGLLRECLGVSIAWMKEEGLLKVKLSAAKNKAGRKEEQIISLISLVLGATPPMACGTYTLACLPHAIGKGGKVIKKLEQAETVRLAMVPRQQDDGAQLVGWFRASSIAEKPDLAHWKEKASTKGDAIKEQLHEILVQANENTKKKTGAGVPELGRTFSMEYQTMKFDRGDKFDRDRRKDDDRKRNVKEKEARVKRERRKQRFAGGVHGGRHKVGEQEEGIPEEGEGRVQAEGSAPEDDDDEEEEEEERVEDKVEGDAAKESAGGASNQV